MNIIVNAAIGARGFHVMESESAWISNSLLMLLRVNYYWYEIVQCWTGVEVDSIEYQIKVPTVDYLRLEKILDQICIEMKQLLMLEPVPGWCQAVKSIVCLRNKFGLQLQRPLIQVLGSNTCISDFWAVELVSAKFSYPHCELVAVNASQ